MLVQQQNGCYGVMVQPTQSSYQMQKQPPSYESSLPTVPLAMSQLLTSSQGAPPLLTMQQQSLAMSSAVATFVPDIVLVRGSGTVMQSTTSNNSSASLPPRIQFDLQPQPDLISNQSAVADIAALSTGLYQTYL